MAGGNNVGLLLAAIQARLCLLHVALLLVACHLIAAIADACSRAPRKAVARVTMLSGHKVTRIHQKHRLSAAEAT